MDARPIQQPSYDFLCGRLSAFQQIGRIGLAINISEDHANFDQLDLEERSGVVRIAAAARNPWLA
jgi:hypothetical protein